MAANGDVALFDDAGGPGGADRGAGADRDYTASVTGGGTDSRSRAASAGPSLTIETTSGAVTLDAEALQFYLLLVQTTLLVYVTYKEVSA